MNIGSRQDGRLRGANVVDCPHDTDAFVAAAKNCLFDERFREICRNGENPYGLGDAGRKIADILATVPLDQRLIRKRMTLLGEAGDGRVR